MYDYHFSSIRQERLPKGLDHCESSGPSFSLQALLISGKVRHPEDLAQEFTTDPGRPVIYAVDERLAIRIAFDGMRGQPDAVKHESLFHNSPVRAAGEMQFRDGRVISINDRSGSYGTYGKIDTDARFVESLLASLDGIGVQLYAVERRRLLRKAGIK